MIFFIAMILLWTLGVGFGEVVLPKIQDWIVEGEMIKESKHTSFNGMKKQIRHHRYGGATMHNFKR